MRMPGMTAIGLAVVLVAPAGAWAQGAACAARHQAFVEGGVAQGQMRVANNGEPCSFTFKFGGNFNPSDWKIEEAPKHGRLDVGGSTVRYTPEAGYAGADEFTVAVFGYNPMLGHGHRARDGRFHISVEVRAARRQSSEPKG